MKVVAVATDDADANFLASLTGDKALVFYTSSGNYANAFDQAERAIFNRQLFDSGTGAYGYREALARVAGWTMWLSLGMALALILGQMRMLRKKFPSTKLVSKMAIGSAQAGFLAGSAGQVLFSIFADRPSADVYTRTVSWGLLGAVLGWGMSYVVPNLPAKRALQGGAIGGTLGGLGFIGLSSVLGDVAGRLSGAILIGAALGLAVGLVEILFREAWLTVVFGPNEFRSVSLGREPVIVGSGDGCTIYVAGAAPAELTYSLDNGRLSCVDHSNGRSEQAIPGVWRTVGSVALAVNTPDVRADIRSSGIERRERETSSKGAAVRRAGQSIVQVQTAGEVRGTACPFVIRLGSGVVIALRKGVCLFGSDLGARDQEAVMAIAQVQRHPHEDGEVGLLNLSTRSWRVRSEKGDSTTISQGRTITLKRGLTLDFGLMSGYIEDNVS